MKFDFDDRQQQSRTVEALLRCAISLLDADDEHAVPARGRPIGRREAPVVPRNRETVRGPALAALITGKLSHRWAGDFPIDGPWRQSSWALGVRDVPALPALLQRPCRNTWLDAPVAVALQHRAHFRRVNDAQGHDAVARADAAMYRAKRDGQDRVSVG